MSKNRERKLGLLLLIPIILIILVFSLSGCADHYKEIKPESPKEGMIMKIDSTKWTQSLTYVSDNKISIYRNGEVKSIYIIDGESTFLVGFLMGVAFVMIICILVSVKY